MATGSCFGTRAFYRAPVVKFLISISPKLAGTVARVLTIIVICLTFASLVAGVLQFVLDPEEPFLSFLTLFNVGEDTNIPTWYSSITLLLCSVLLIAIAVHKKKREEAYALHWGMLSVIFLLMSMDEVARTHEITGSMLKRGLVETIGVRPSGFVFFAWVIPGAIFVVLIALAYAKFLIDLPRKIRHLFLGAGTLYVAGALVLEMVSAQKESLYWGETMPRGTTIFVNLTTTVEELFEMLGIVIFIYALLLYIASYMDNAEAQTKRSE